MQCGKHREPGPAEYTLVKLPLRSFQLVSRVSGSGGVVRFLPGNGQEKQLLHEPPKY
jgi:hypothetical protein